MSTNKVYAVKVVSQSRVSRLDNRGKVEREIELHSKLKHRNVVGFHRHFADRENIYMVLEYCSRKSLAHILKARKTLTEPEVRFYLKQIITGLQYIHQQGIIHRDLKLSNFFITKNMQVKIGDLGLATQEEQANRRRGVVCGTPNYLAPEVVSKKGHSFKSDMWALGCIMYTALTGCSPFEITHKQEMYQCIREGRYPMPSHLSPSARELIGKLLAPDPAARPSLEETLNHAFFTQGFTPARLSSRACHSAPIFSLPNPLRKFFQKAAKVLFRGSSCQESRTVSPLPQKESLPRGTPCCPVIEDPSLGEKEKEDMNRTEDASHLPVHLLMKGSLNNSRSEAKDGEWTPGSVLETVDQVLHTCLQTIPLAEQNPENQHQGSIIRMVTKWVDYSNKYGFGYLVSDGSTGVLLADGTHIALCPLRQRICYCREAHKAAYFPRREFPASLTVKVGILNFFTQYMQQRLLEGGHQQADAGSSTGDLYLLQFAKSDEALLMLFSDGTLQVNFYHDRTKIVLSRPAGEYLWTFVDRQRQGTTFSLDTLARQGWTLPLRERVEYALRMLHCL
ncbi:serine/threonine-protein kinase PLK2-like isoform X4 [Hemicordylus capensis]|nr:serine/threonine-protein kinase PLK2-like isoform X4 [Hemicordylus capensis]XP_053156496.1 serine/threonine-protein kinase PLK2-like isoform X4 [Hemicordylus capensis]XP_053156498.1 serine/threonine-protein kinase PLK2-like isoform X4 [Hemicordylus capensis]XP_053156499.1 serine/threonine-protein kinase PLK2-like isoform X4 [Hemicordylus capensis]